MCFGPGWTYLVKVLVFVFGNDVADTRLVLQIQDGPLLNKIRNVNPESKMTLML